MKATVVFFLTLTVWFQTINAGYNIGNYYASHPLKLSWWEASRFCNVDGKQLIDIADEQEHIDIRNILNEVRKNDPSIATSGIWTSGIRFPDEKKYYWEISGLPVMYANWVPGDPHMSPNEKCIFLMNPNWEMADGGCDARFSFICKNVPCINERFTSLKLNKTVAIV